MKLAAQWRVPSPRHFAKNQTACYWFSGLRVRTPASVLEQAPAGSTRTTASSSAQKPRMPLWLIESGVARAVYPELTPPTTLPVPVVELVAALSPACLIAVSGERGVNRSSKLWSRRALCFRQSLRKILCFQRAAGLRLSFDDREEQCVAISRGTSSFCRFGKRFTTGDWKAAQDGSVVRISGGQSGIAAGKARAGTSSLGESRDLPLEKP